MDLAAKGAAALTESKYAEAIELYTKALQVSPGAVDYYIKRSTAYQRSSPANYQAALDDAETAVVLAHKRGKRELIAQAQLRRGIALFGLERYGDAKFVLEIVKRMDDKEKMLAIWMMKTDQKLKALPEDDTKREVTVKEVPDKEVNMTPVTVPKKAETKTEPSNEASTASEQSKPVPPPQGVHTPVDKIRHDWYQNNENVYFSLMVKGVPKEQATVDIKERTLDISFPLANGSTFDYSLDPTFAPVDVANSSFKILSTKVEVTLRKATPGEKWKKLESDELPAEKEEGTDKVAPVPKEVLTARNDAHLYPSSSKKGPKDWDKLAADIDKKKSEKEKKSEKAKGKEAAGSKDDDDDLDYDDVEGDPANAFFKKLFDQADPDTKRAMMKSMYESQGTHLSTNWGEVSKGFVTPSPPDGMEIKKYGE